MTNGIVRFAGVFNDIQEAYKWAEMVAVSEICPPVYKNKPQEILLIAQFGHEIGLKPITSIIWVRRINGQLAVYGDMQLAMCTSSSKFEWMNEEFLTAEELFTKYGKNDDFPGLAAVCHLKVKGEEPALRWFSEKNAIKAKLWGKVGPWTTFPERMLQMRARSFALRDKFADVLNGLVTVEEANDYIDIQAIQEPEVDKETGEIITAQDSLPPSMVDTGMVEEMTNLISHLQLTDEKISVWLKKMGVEYINDLTFEQAERMLEYLKKMAVEKSGASDV